MTKAEEVRALAQQKGIRPKKAKKLMQRKPHGRGARRAPLARRP
jgi:hypothetical protein